MKFLLLAALVVCASARVVPVSLYTPAADRIPGEYLIQWSPNAVGVQSFEAFKSKARSFSPADVSIHEFGEYRGALVRLTDEELFMVQQMEGVSHIEPNTVARMFGEQSPATWGIDRSDQRSGTNNIYRWRDDAAGQGVGIYVLDTGIFTDHSDFNGRASYVADCYSLLGLACETANGTPGDPQGHGTHCAGTVGSTTYGIAKNATLFNIRVLSALGTGSIGGIVNGVNFAVNHNFNGVKIISMSLGGGAAAALDNAVNAAFNVGVLSVVATGNSNNNGCNGSPAGAAQAFTVSASDIRDTKASFSSYGPCVDIWAPGVDITSTSRTGGTAVYSGTSMACPHVAGAAALIASRGITSPAEIRDTLIAESTENALSGVPSGTVNRLLFTNP